MIAHVVSEVDFLGFTIRFDLDHAATGAVVRRNEDTIAARDGRGYVRYPVRRLHILPQQLAIVRIETKARRAVKKTTCVPPFTCNGIADE